MGYMRIDGRFRFHPVGQGLFYSGVLTNDDDDEEPFSFVYDCGTENKQDDFLSPRIKTYANRLPQSKTERDKKRLDLLVVSHFHADHVNGIPKLLNLCRAGAVVLPYMSESYRALAIAEYSLTMKSDADREDAMSLKDSDVTRFYANPSAWLAERGVSAVAFVGAGDGTPDDLSKDLTPPDPRLTRPEGPVTLVEDGEGGDFYLTIPSENVLGVRNVSHPIGGGATRTIKEVYLKDGMSPAALTKKSGLAFWEFFFENIKRTPEELRKYRDLVSDFLTAAGDFQGKTRPLTLEELLTEKATITEALLKGKKLIAEDGSLTEEGRKFLTEEKLKALKKTASQKLNAKLIRLLSDKINRDCKDILDGYDLNRTSVVMLHRPSEGRFSHAQYAVCDDCPYPHRYPHRYPYPYDCYPDHSYCWLKLPQIHSCNKCGALLTGDVVITEDDDTQLEDILEKARDCGVLQYPHHGSGENNDMNRFLGLNSAVTVVPYGVHNTYRHPSNDVLDEFVKNGRVIRSATQYEAFTYWMYVFLSDKP